MPYIKGHLRHEFDPKIAALNYDLSPGSLNYIITRLVQMYWEKNPNYTTAAELVGVLSNVKDEFYREVIAKYEDEKKTLNGPVY